MIIGTVHYNQAAGNVRAVAAAGNYYISGLFTGYDYIQAIAAGRVNARYVIRTTPGLQTIWAGTVEELAVGAGQVIPINMPAGTIRINSWLPRGQAIEGIATGLNLQASAFDISIWGESAP